MVHSINRKVRGGNVMVKVDMATKAKAYDRMDWDFLLNVLRVLVNFLEHWLQLIKNCITSPSFYVMMMAASRDFFQSNSGIETRISHISILVMLAKEANSKLQNKEFQASKIGFFNCSI